MTFMRHFLLAAQLQHVVSEVRLGIIVKTLLRRILAEGERLAHQHEFAVAVNDAHACAHLPARQLEGALVGFKQLLQQLAQVNLAFADVDRKSTRLNSSHTVISYAVFCLKKK